MSKKVVIDFETQNLEGLAEAALTLAKMEQAVAQAAASFGRPSFIMMPAAMGWHPNPQYAGVPWADMYRMTKREHAFAKLHAFLYKFNVLKNLSEEQHETIRNTAIKRLKRAKWARYGSSPK